MRPSVVAELIRIPNSTLSGLGAVFAYLVYSGYRLHPIDVLVAFATGFLVTGASMIINDVVDTEVDRVNKPWKPIPRGEASPTSALRLAYTLIAMALVLNILVEAGRAVVTLVYSAIGVSYSYLRRKTWSHTLVALSTTGPVIYGYVAAGLPGRDLVFTLVFTATIFTVTLAREFLKAIQDIEGDMKLGYKTVATVYGVEKASKLMLVTGILGSAMGIASVTLNTSLVYKALITTAAALYLYSIHQAYKHRESREKLEKTRRETMIAMYIGILAFWLSKTPA